MQAERKALMLRRDDGNKTAGVCYAISTDLAGEESDYGKVWPFLEAYMEGSKGSCVQGIL